MWGYSALPPTHLTLHTRSERKRRDGRSSLHQRWPPGSARASVTPKVQPPPSHQVYWIHASAREDKAVLRAQSRVQKSRLSRKGFSAAGTGVTSGSSLACVSQKARSSAAACDTCRRGAEMQLTRPRAFGPSASDQIPAPCPDHALIGHAPGRGPPSHSALLQAPPSTQPGADRPPPPSPRRPKKKFPPRLRSPSCDRCSLPASAAPPSCGPQRSWPCCWTWLQQERG